MSKLWLLLNGVIVAIIGVISYQSIQETPKSNAESPKEVMAVAQDPLTIELTLEKHYIDGKVEREQVEETIASMQDFWAEYQDWQVMEQKEGHIRFRKEVNDISPYLKANGYFGIKNGKLTIFEGVPVQESAVQSFYQIDTDELESHLYERLKEGIKINTKKDYSEVLETFRSYQKAEAVNS
ncbi:intercompartmental signaling factor BofC [Gracilibacillus caseinilyticus]|uniref:Intercompartmental signaling factor BofC n=1 Tax=Gracilibacillus caseinilyticus TaxID=2932256 RepID=A0ABY4ESB2_9BACI|nr:BofC C-terminal domain-containing protein [Gracilibacillus caseinilyticus]UOQ47317.1 intercompartmental signaling factor BofC [Gracilibacillus caseinilyticus]